MKEVSSLLVTFRSIRKRTAWASLAGGVVIFAGQWWAHTHYIDRINWIDRSPSLVNALGAFLTVANSVAGISEFASMAILPCSSRRSLGCVYLDAGDLA